LFYSRKKSSEGFKIILPVFKESNLKLLNSDRNIPLITHLTIFSRFLILRYFFVSSYVTSRKRREEGKFQYCTDANSPSVFAQPQMTPRVLETRKVHMSRVRGRAHTKVHACYSHTLPRTVSNDSNWSTRGMEGWREKGRMVGDSGGRLAPLAK